jgi:hypothetical protein
MYFKTPQFLNIKKGDKQLTYKFSTYQECSKWCISKLKEKGMSMPQTLDFQFKNIDDFFRKLPNQVDSKSLNDYVFENVKNQIQDEIKENPEAESQSSSSDEENKLNIFLYKKIKISSSFFNKEFFLFKEK